MTPENPPPRKSPGAVSRQMALAMELPFLLAGGALVGGFLGYLLDHWLHTKVLFLIVLGGLGFAGGLREVLRRLP